MSENAVERVVGWLADRFGELGRAHAAIARALENWSIRHYANRVEKRLRRGIGGWL